MPKMFQLHEEDLSELERTLPQLAETLMPLLNNRLRVQLRRCQSILSAVRWSYGPHTDVTEISGEPGLDQAL